MKIFKTLLLLVLLQVAALAQRPAGYTLKVGDVYRVNMEAKQEIAQTMMGQTQETQQTTANVDDYEVIAASNGIYTIKTTSIQRKLESSGPMGSMVIDSDSDGPQNAPFKAMANQTYQFKMNKMGEILEVEGLESMTASIREGLTDSGLGAQADDILAAFQEETLKSTLSQQFSFYEPQMNDSWSKSNSMEVLGSPITTNSTFQWEGNNIINGASDLAMSGDIEQMGMAMKMDVSGIQQTKITLDEATGMPTKVVIDQEISGDVEAQGMTIPLSITGTTTSTIVKQK